MAFSIETILYFVGVGYTPTQLKSVMNNVLLVPVFGVTPQTLATLPEIPTLRSPQGLRTSHSNARVHMIRLMLA